MTRFALVFAACAWAAFGSVGLGQPPAAPVKGAELLKIMAGTWDVTAKAAGVESKGAAVIKLELGGRWVTSELKVELLGQTFEQRGLGTYDDAKKKFVFAWGDTLSTTLHSFEGAFDEAGKKLTTSGELPGPDGKSVRFKIVVEPKSGDQFVQSLIAVIDGKEQEMATLTYTRKK